MDSKEESNDAPGTNTRATVVTSARELVSGNSTGFWDMSRNAMELAQAAGHRAELEEKVDEAHSRQGDPEEHAAIAGVLSAEGNSEAPTKEEEVGFLNHWLGPISS